ncbi:MAG: type III-B CRISPR-associated protein Cas10/Cmr2 [Armatimonadetes bacterium]|nr:type III-B CRISPR-associated protein Cas10/Cmr2 [Armatimonadota bacterium]
MTKYLMTIALGPVQEFIAAARRTADLTAGSELLVELARHLANYLQSQHDAELIFPASPQSDAPNKLLFTVQGEPHKIAADAKEQAHTYLRQQWEACLQQLGAVKGCIDEELANWQLKNFLEFYAAWAPLNGKYAEARRRLEQLLAGRKALRDFKQAPAYSKHPKSPLDPAMDSVFRSEKPVDGFSAPAVAQQHPKLRLKPRETLDAISLIKRVLGGSGVPSTREMGFRAVEKALSKEALGAYRALQHSQEELGIDDLSDLFFQENFRRICQERQTEEGWRLTPEQLEEVCADASTLRKALNDAKISEEVLRYYAILVADGDRMGAAIDALTSVDDHRNFSRQVAQFAQNAERIVDAHDGHLVYCGGDDVLALLPANRALACARKLHEAFVSCMQPVMPAGQTPSLSAGIAIVHVMDNLQVALGWARETEQYAKQLRNAVAVARYPRSGGMNRARTRWDDFDAWDYWIRAFRAGLADTLPYELRALARDYQAIDVPPDILRKEAMRVLERKQKPQQTIVIPDWVQSADDLHALTEMMLIARFLSGYPEV